MNGGSYLNTWSQLHRPSRRKRHHLAWLKFAANFDFQVQGVEIEGGDAMGVDVAYPWEDSARRFHHHEIKMSRHSGVSLCC